MSVTDSGGRKLVPNVLADVLEVDTGAAQRIALWSVAGSEQNTPRRLIRHHAASDPAPELRPGQYILAARVRAAGENGAGPHERTGTRFSPAGAGSAARPRAQDGSA